MTRAEVDRIRAVASERFYKADKRSDKSRESTIIRLCDALEERLDYIEKLHGFGKYMTEETVP